MNIKFCDNINPLNLSEGCTRPKGHNGFCRYVPIIEAQEVNVWHLV